MTQNQLHRDIPRRKRRSRFEIEHIKINGTIQTGRERHACRPVRMVQLILMCLLQNAHVARASGECRFRVTIVLFCMTSQVGHMEAALEGPRRARHHYIHPGRPAARGRNRPRFTYSKERRRSLTTDGGKFIASIE